MPRGPHRNQDDASPLFTWAFLSTRPEVGGAQAAYTVQLRKNGVLSCDCPGWVYSRGSPTTWEELQAGASLKKMCKHTNPSKELGKIVHGEIPAVLEAWREGKELPTVTVHSGQVSSGQSRLAVTSESQSSIQFGRVIEA